MPGITLENAMPTASAGTRKTKPASGPAIPISKSARREKMGDRIRMNAPNVPKTGDGRK